MLNFLLSSGVFVRISVSEEPSARFSGQVVSGREIRGSTIGNGRDEMKGKKGKKKWSSWTSQL